MSVSKKDIKEDLLLGFFDALENYHDAKNDDYLRNRLIKQAILNAYEDATRQGAYNAILIKRYKNEFSDEAIKKNSIDAKECAINRITMEITNLINDEHDFTEKEYNTWHKTLCGTMINIHRGAEPENSLMDIYYKKNLIKVFTVGNAQKWVNMAIKYLYVYAELLENMNEFGMNATNPLHKILGMKKYFHIPLDRYVLKAVFYNDTQENSKWESIDKTINKKDGNNYANHEGAICFRTDEEGNIFMNSQLCELTPKGRRNKNTAYVTWSNIQYYENYLEIQNQIKECLSCNNEFKKSPLNWENRIWLKAAKLEREGR